MATITTYDWKPYSDGGLANPEGQMTAYHSDPANNPPQWQDDYLEGMAKVEALAIVQADRTLDEPTNNFDQKVMSPTERIVRRKSKRTGNAWEVALDPDGWPLPDPFTGYVPAGGPWPIPTVPTPPDPIPVTTLYNATVKVEKPAYNRVRFTIEGNTTEA